MNSAGRHRRQRRGFSFFRPIGDYSPLAAIPPRRLRHATDWEFDIWNHAIESEWFRVRATKAYAKVETERYKSTPGQTEWSEERTKSSALSRATQPSTPTMYAPIPNSSRLPTRALNRKWGETAAATLKHSKVDLKTEKEITKRNKSEKLALLEALSHHGLVRYDDLEGVNRRIRYNPASKLSADDQA